MHQPHSTQRPDLAGWSADCDPIPTPSFAAVITLALLVCAIFVAGAIAGVLIVGATA